jgi:hypothetical protein
LCLSWEDVVKLLDSDQITLNTLALISKQKEDGTWKYRIIWDLLRSGVNSRVHQGERIILPRVLDVAQDVLDLIKLSRPGEEIYFFGTDVSDAFHQILLRQNEWRFTVAEFAGKYYVFTVLVIGSASAPTVWGSMAGTIHIIDHRSWSTKDTNLRRRPDIHHPWHTIRSNNRSRNSPGLDHVLRLPPCLA